jgi:hypothetical protein
MRVEHLSNGRDQPQGWVLCSMIGLSIAALASPVLVFSIHFVVGKPLPPKKNPFDMESLREEEEGRCPPSFYALSFVRYSILVCLCGGLALVAVGICTYMPPGTTKLAEVSAPAPAITCTMILSIVFFSTQLIVAVCRSYMELTRVRFPQIVGMMHAAAASVDYAPMLAALFLAAQMRASQHDTQPQESVQNCMFVATGAMCVTALLAMMVPLTLGGAVRKNPWSQAIVVELRKPTIGYIFIALRFLCMLCFYAAAAGVVASLFDFQSPGGATATLPVSPAVQCVVSLTCQFFFVYFVWTVMLTISELNGSIIPMEQWTLFSAVEAARSTLTCAPMMSMLFLVVRMHALRITEKTGAPQGWVQDGMYIATWALQVSGLMCLGIGLFMATVDADGDGNFLHKLSNKLIGIIVIAMRYFSMLLVFGGMIIVVVGLFCMTSENAIGRGSFADVYGGGSSTNPMPFAPRSSRLAEVVLLQVHAMVQMGSL